MADLSITAANVQQASGAQRATDGIAGETITAGMALYQKSSDSRWWKADSNSATTEQRAASKIALNNASAGQPISLHGEGPINIGGTVVVGTIYVLSATAGGIAPSTDLASGWYTQVIGIGRTTSELDVQFHSAGVAVP